MATSKPQPHAIIFPYMAQGHALPLLDFAKVLSQRGLKVTIITTPSNSDQFSSRLSTKSTNISIHVIPFPVSDDLPPGCENTKDLTSEDQLLSFVRATLKLKEPFECFLRDTVDNEGYPLCVVCDFFLRWAIPICSSYDVPGIVFHGMGVLPTVICYLANEMHGEFIKRLANDEEFTDFPGFTSPFPLALDDFPTIKYGGSVSRVVTEYGEGCASSSCWGILSNSFEGIEGEFVGAIETAFGRDITAWCVGPLHLYNDNIIPMSQELPHMNPTDMEMGVAQIYDREKNGNVLNPPLTWYESWLDEQEEKKEGVLYVSFGTQSYLSKVQMDEIALGLEKAGQHFIWVVRSMDWTPPEGWEERVNGQGLVIREWVDQQRILAHRVILGFMTHCGWNSVLESLSCGVPMLVWPLIGDQPVNAKVVVHVLKAGIGMTAELVTLQKEQVFGCDEICRGVKELMGGETGRLARERAQEIGKLARNAVQKDGSSCKKIDQLITYLTDQRKNV